MSQIFSNAARGYLSAPIGATDTNFTLNGLGGLFDAANGSNWWKGVLQDTAGFEIVHCTAHGAGSDNFTVKRGQEGTVARAFAAGSVFGQRVTAADMNALMFDYQPKTVSENTVLDANTEYVTGSGLHIMSGANLQIPVTTKLEIKPFMSGKKF